MNLTLQSQAVMLLTVSFGKADQSDAKPLSTKEWACFAGWLKDHELGPSDLLSGDLKSLLGGWTHRSITLPRLESLLNRGGALGFALEKWQRANLWVITRSDPEYPQRLKRRLKADAPPVLFGCGDKALLESGGLAVVGSRNAGRDDLAFAENLGDTAARQGYAIVSGGARGVDESAMSGALRNGGIVIGVLANGLLRATTSAGYREYLVSGNLTLTTPFNPEAGFSVGNAMSRNRYIYCLADEAVVVSSTPDKGGTWNGAVENLQAEWVPLWVKHTESAESGNLHLVRQGARRLPDDLTSLPCLSGSLPTGAAGEEAPGLSRFPDGTEYPATPETIGVGEPVAEGIRDQGEPDFYTFFLWQMDNITDRHPMKTEEIVQRLDLVKKQVSVWLKRGVNDGRIRKLKKPVRYQSTRGEQRQGILL